MDKLNKKIVVCGSIGALGALLTIIADIAYNMWGGNQIGSSLYISFLGLFSFPLWWGGIWVIYQGLKPAGKMWSLVPCLLFAFYVSTVNVYYHSCYPFKAALKGNQAIATGDSLQLINKILGQATPYTDLMGNIDLVLQIAICVWIAIAILTRKTHFPKWVAFIIPIFPVIAAELISLVCKGFMKVVGPYLACVPMLILFIVLTTILSKKCKLGLLQE